MAIIDDFKVQFPEFDPLAVDAQWSTLEAMWPCLYGGEYGVSSCQDQAILNLIAHLFYVDESGDQSAYFSIVSQSVGSVSVTNLINSNQSDYVSFFNSSKYGQRYLLLTNKRSGAVFV